MLPTLLKPGDIIGFSGRSVKSSCINIATGGIPLWGISHVGIMGRSHDGELLLYESTEEPQVCAVSGNFHRGVQGHHLNDVLANYDGRIWCYGLYRRLYTHESARLTTFLDGALGNGYDKAGAIRASGFLFALLNSLIYGQDLTEKFCSELCAAGLSRMGLFPTGNASRWNPNRLIRSMRRAGALKRPCRLK